MAIAPTVLAANINTTDATSFTTASVAVASHYNELITLAVFSIGSADPPVPTLTTARGLNIVQVATGLESTNHARITIFRTCISSGGATGTLTIDFAGNTQFLAAWELLSWTGTRATAGNNGSDGVGVSNSTVAGSGGGTTVSTTLAALQTGSATYGANTHGVGEVTNPGSGYVELTDKTAAGPATGFETEWKLVGSTTVNASWATSGGSFPRIIVGCEILQAFSGTGAFAASAASLSATGHEDFEATAGFGASAASLSAAARQDFIATGAEAATAVALSSTASERFIGVGGTAVAAASLLATAHEDFVTSGGISAAPAALQGTGALVFTSSGGLNGASASFGGTGHQEEGGAGNFAAAPAALAGTGRERFISTAALAGDPAALVGNGSTGGGIAGGGGFAAAPSAFGGDGFVAQAPRVQIGGGSWESKKRGRVIGGFLAAPASFEAYGRVTDVMADDEEVLLVLT